MVFEALAVPQVIVTLIVWFWVVSIEYVETLGELIARATVAAVANSKYPCASITPPAPVDWIMMSIAEDQPALLAAAPPVIVPVVPIVLPANFTLPITVGGVTVLL